MEFRMPTKVVFEAGCLGRLRGLVEENCRTSRIILVTDAGIRKTGIIDVVLSQFPEAPVFDEVEPNPRHGTVDRAGEIIRSLHPDVVLAVGGGSVLDAGKAAALLGTNPGLIEDYEGRGKYKHPPLPVVAVPTTCGTGSEVTWVSVVTQTERRFKMSIKGPLMFPALAVVDPDLLKTLPPGLVASTGLDALTHAVEAYTVKPATFITDIFARQAMSLIFSSLEPACRDILNNREAREGLMKGSLLAGFAFGNSDVGSVHCIAEAVGSLYDTPHGSANSAFLPYVVEYNLPAAPERFAEIARLAGIPEAAEEEMGRNLVQKLKDLSRSLRIPPVREMILEESDIPELAEKSFQNNSTPSNIREVTVEDYRKIIESAYEGR
jgi:alcohol dehydrogenase